MKTDVISMLKTIGRRLRSRIEPIFYFGDRVACNVCGRTARSWRRGVENGRCPNCGCPSRTRLLWRYLVTVAAKHDDWNVVHFAPEPPLERRLRTWGARAYRTCDLRGTHVDLNADLQRLPFPDGSYDLVVCSHVLEHVPDDRAAMRELRRICSSRGRVLIMVPLDPSSPTAEDLSDLPPLERKRRFGEIDHLRMYGSDLVELLTTAGFAVTRFDSVNQVPEPERIRNGIAAAETVFVCTPPV